MPVITPAGPVFGPDALSVDVSEGDDCAVVRIYPDAANAQLREAGLPTRYYVQPAYATVASRQGTPGLDFSMTAVVRRTQPAGKLEYVNATGTLTTAMALSTATRDLAFEQLTSRADTMLAQRIRDLFGHAEGDPDPELAMVPMLDSSAACTFTQPEGIPGAPRFSAQTIPAGGIGAQAHNSFLLSCGPDEAKAIATSLKSGSEFPLSVNYVLTEQFSTGDSAINVTIEADVDELAEDFASVMSTDRSITATAASAAIARAISAGTSLRLKVADGGSVLVDPALVAWIGSCVEVKSAVVRLLKAELFDLAAASLVVGPPWWSGLFGQNRVALKSEHDNRGIRLQDVLFLSGSISVERTVATVFTTLTAAAQADISTYLTEIGA